MNRLQTINSKRYYEKHQIDLKMSYKEMKNIITYNNNIFIVQLYELYLK